MKLLYKIILFPAILIITGSACVRIYSNNDFALFRSLGVNSESFIFEENNISAKIKWKKEFGTLQYFGFDEKRYALIGDFVLSKTGFFLYQDHKYIYSFDSLTGDLQTKYERSKEPPYQQRAADLSQMCEFVDKKIIPLKNSVGKIKEFLILKENAPENQVIPIGDAAKVAFCVNEKIIEVVDDAFVAGFQVQELDPRLKTWWVNKSGFSISVYALATDTDAAVFLYRKGNMLNVESYNLATGNLNWKKELRAPKQKDRSFFEAMGIDEHKVVLNELFIVEYVGFNKKTGETLENVTSLNAHTGRINWQMSDLVRVFVRQNSDASPLFYYSKIDEPSVIYGVDQETGEEKLRVALKEYNIGQGILLTADKLYHAGASISEDNKLLYSAFSAVDKRTGKTLWTINIDQQGALPHYEEGILYFGYMPDFYKNIIAGSIKQYEDGFELYGKDDVQKFLRKTAFAVDAETGKVLWKAKLEGGDESYVEKILINGNMTFIKSISGWLYAIEGGKPK